MRSLGRKKKKIRGWKENKRWEKVGLIGEVVLNVGNPGSPSV